MGKRSKGLYGLIPDPAPKAVAMSLSEAVTRAAKHAEAMDPIDYDYLHALRAAALRLDHTRTDLLADALERLLSAEPGTGAADAARKALSNYRGTNT